jgi:hypothetical protein
MSDYVIANFTPKRFDEKVLPGTLVRITGVIKDKTNRLGAILDQCKFVVEASAKK